MENCTNSFNVGQTVKVKVPEKILRTIQEGHGGYTSQMSETMLTTGEIIEITVKGDLRVKYPKNVWTLNPEAVKIVTEQKNILEEAATGLMEEHLRNNVAIIDTAECYVCSENEVLCTLEPCGHKITCTDCSSRIKKCCFCEQLITKRITAAGTEVEYISKDQRPTIDRMRYLEMQIQSFEENLLCGICLERRKDRVFRCGHSSCSICSNSLVVCHICRLPVTEKIHLY